MYTKDQTTQTPNRRPGKRTRGLVRVRSKETPPTARQWMSSVSQRKPEKKKGLRSQGIKLLKKSRSYWNMGDLRDWKELYEAERTVPTWTFAQTRNVFSHGHFFPWTCPKIRSIAVFITTAQQDPSYKLARTTTSTTRIPNTMRTSSCWVFETPDLQLALDPHCLLGCPRSPSSACDVFCGIALPS